MSLPLKHLALALTLLACDSKAPPAAPDATAPAVDGQAPAADGQAPAPDAQAPAADTQAPAPDAAVRTPPVKVTTVEGITEHRLDNGLRVLLFPDPSKTTVTVNMTYMVGSRHEGYGESGMAHLLEHMMFKGTPTHPKVWEEMQNRGAQFNGTTDYDRTNYYEIVPATEDNIAWALGLEADRMVHSKIAAEDLASEFSVVRNEFERGENDPAGILYERMLSAAYLWHSYGKSPIGSRSDIERVPVDNLRTFYERYYQPDNAVLVVAGKIVPDQILNQIDALYGAIPKPTRVLPTSYTVEPVQDGERSVTLRRVGDTQIVGVAYHTVAGSDALYPASEAAAHVLTNEPSGRLYVSLVKGGLASRVWAMQQPLAEPGHVLFFAEVAADKPVEPVKAAMLAAIEGLGQHPPSDEELARWKAEEAKDFDLNMSSSEYAAVILTDWQALGDWRLLFVHRDRVAALTSADVQTFAASYFKPSNRTLGWFQPDKAPDRSPLPERPEIGKLVDGYEGKATEAKGEIVEATVAALEARTTRTKVGGVKLALLPKETRGGVVRAEMLLQFGTPEALKGRVDAGNVVPDMLLRGTAKHDFQQLKDELARLKAEVQIEGAGLVPRPGQIAVHVTTTRENLAAVMALVAEVLREPTFPADQFEILRGEYLTQLEGQLSDPQALALTAALRKALPLPPEALRYVPTVPESIARTKALKLEDVKRFHADFYGASNAQLAVVGDFDPKALEAQVGELFGAWASKSPYERVGTAYQANEVGATAIDTPDKEGAFILAVQALELKDDDPDYPALTLYNFIYGGGIASRLNSRLRQKEGWSYGTFSQLDASPFEPFGIFVAGALVNPANAPKAMAAMLEEDKKLVDEGVPAAELGEAQKAWQSQFDTELSDDRAVATNLVQGLFRDRTLEWDKAMNDKIAALTAEGLKAVLAKGRIKPELWGTVIASDQKKATP